ncbi:uncharacterized protein BcabD6B2_29980 [Babesia caballi]|uniref:Uncharacterized protein n=1 Tax=Babesia caballi TaxID=5871 RepID=A0AAV4LUD3_BABCB|nr:hypothetical protein BcabD6B2_29980 [Babesia caballi]
MRTCGDTYGTDRAAEYPRACADRKKPTRTPKSSTPKSRPSTSSATGRHVRQPAHVRRQSVWNLTFMRPWNVIALLFRTVRLAAIELCFAFTNDTFLFDSPLSMKGINQALELSKELSHLDGPESNDLKALTHESTQSSVIFTSNLRRAQSTVVLALHDRLNRTGETIQVCNELEEVVSHADCVALSTNLQCSTIPLLEVMMVPDIAKMYSRTLQHTKGPGVSHLSVYEKMLRFNERVFRQNEDTIIVCGHSRWLRNYLGIFLPAGSTDVEYRGKKIGNVDTLKFDLTRREFKNGDVCYVVDPESVKLVYKNAK